MNKEQNVKNEETKTWEEVKDEVWYEQKTVVKVAKTSIGLGAIVGAIGTAIITSFLD